MKKVREYNAIYDVNENSNMATFGRCCIPGFRMERGYGYYEFREPEFIKPHRNVILVDKVGAKTKVETRYSDINNYFLFTARKIVHWSWCKVFLHWMRI